METPFNTWWATLTPKEQSVIGINNARFVWNAASLAAARECEHEAEYAMQAVNPACAWRLANIAKKLALEVK